VRCSGCLTTGRRSCLQGHNRLTAGHFTDDLHKGLSVLDLLNVHDDDVGVRIIGRCPEVVKEVQVSLVPDRDHHRKADVLGEGEVDDGVDDSPALGDKRDVPRVWRLSNIGGVQSDWRDDQSQAVRPDDPGPVPVGDLDDSILEQMPFLAHLLESGSDDHSDLHSFLPALLHDTGNVPGRDGDDREVH